MLKLCSAPERMIHHIVGVARTSEIGRARALREPTVQCASAWPRVRARGRSSSAAAHEQPGHARHEEGRAATLGARDWLLTR